MSGFTSISKDSNLSLLSLGTFGSDASSYKTVNSFLDSDNNLLATESTLIDVVAKIWNIVSQNITKSIQPSNISETPIKTKTPTYQNAQKLKDYIDKLNNFTNEYKQKKNNSNVVELEWIKKLEELYTNIQNVETKPTKDEITELFTLALESESLRNMFMPNNLVPDSSGLKLTPEQIKLFQIEVATDKVNTKLGKLLKVEQVIHNVMSRLKLRKLVLNRIKLNTPPPVEEAPTFTEKFLDVVHNIDTALTWIDEPVNNEPVQKTELNELNELKELKELIELKELRAIRTTIVAKLKDLQTELTGQLCNHEPNSQEIMNFYVRDTPAEEGEVVSETGFKNILGNKKKYSQETPKDDSSQKKQKPCVSNTLGNAVKTTMSIVKPDDTTKSDENPSAEIENLLSKLKDAKQRLETQDISTELFTNEYRLSETSLKETPIDINFILGIKSGDNSPNGGKRKKSHKLTRRNKQKGSNRRRANKKGKTAKRAKRSTKKH
jgi:hypothetical protein